jgi:DNA excision repair protein ERCC-5
MLESLNLTQGTITDDNDVFLFGGSSVYRHVFSSDRDLMSYSMQDVKGLLGLDRNKLILLAYLLGSDYTDGIDGIGCVHATEMIQCFNGDGLEPLINMRNCQMEPHQSQSENALFKKIKRVTFPTDFPQENVKEAYINPSIDNSTEPFEWGRADLDLIREYTSTKFGWSQADNDKKLLPVLKRANEPIQQQTNISTYFTPPQPLIVTSSSSHKSKRLRNAVTRLTGKSVETKTSSAKKGKRTNQRKRKADTDIAYPVR